MKLVIRQSYFVCLLLLFASSCVSVSAQVRANDLIIKKDSTRIECKIQVVTDNSFQYKKANDPEGPVFHILKSDIVRVVYGNGETETLHIATVRPGGRNSESMIYYPSSPWLFPDFTTRLTDWTPDELRGARNFYNSKFNARKATAIVSGAMGLTFSIIGIVLISSSRTNDGVYGYYTDDGDKRQIGQLMLVGGLGAGIPITIANGVRAKKYRKKTALVEGELAARKLSAGQLKFRPSFNANTHSASVFLTYQF